MIILGSAHLFDNSSLSDFRERGPRYWYFRHFRGWVRAPHASDIYTIPATTNGTAWHLMMDSYWQNPAAGWEPAWAAYEEFWQSEGLAGGFPIDQLDPEFARQLQPYAPETVQEILIAYDEIRRPLLSQIELLHCERPFIVPLDPNDPTLFFIGRMDKVFRYQNKLVIADHKTTSYYHIKPLGRAHIPPSWKAQWRVATQPRGYLYDIKHEFKLDRASMWMDAVLFHAEHRDFDIVPIECQLAALDRWLWDTHYWIDQVRQHIYAVQELRAADKAAGLSYLPAFPCHGCKGSCPYADLCMARDNPETWLADEPPPEGFIENKWAPFKVEEVEAAIQQTAGGVR